MQISIHALREEGDFCPLRWASIPGNFYPRPPRGGRPALAGVLVGVVLISIHALREEGDGVHFYKDDYQFISIHALREEGDCRREA